MFISWKLDCFKITVLLFLCRTVAVGGAIRKGVEDKIQNLVQKWAPLVFLAPGEKFFPSSVTDFLDHMIPIPLQDTGSTIYEKPLSDLTEESSDDLPKGRSSESWYLTSREDLETLLRNKSSFIYGRNPQEYSVPIYALIEVCQNEYTVKKRYDKKRSYYNRSKNDSDENYPNFHVTYWMFYPFSQGKSLCTFDMGRFGAWPIPKVNNYCLGNIKEFGSHVGDWEHISLYFEGSENPKRMYVSTHDVGAFYRYSKDFDRFEYESQEIRRGILQRPMFPPVMRLSKPGNHPILFSAKGSHGLWTAPGRHRFVRLPRLHDDSGFGIPWFTWKNVQLLKAVSPTERNWLRYHGKWGNPKSRCHPISKLGINICEISDGPTGIPLKKKNFHCPLTPNGNQEPNREGQRPVSKSARVKLSKLTSPGGSQIPAYTSFRNPVVSAADWCSLFHLAVGAFTRE